MNTLDDLSGKRFGRWTVLFQSPNKFKSRATMWHCRCDCGNEKDISRSNLLSGKTKSCGCYRKEQSQMIDVTKRIFDDHGILTHKLCPVCKEYKSIEHFAPKSSNADGYSEYCNDCIKYSLNRRYSKYLNGARKRRLQFDISKSEFDFITKQPCVYCGEYAFIYQSKGINGIDRVDSKIGYVKGNIVPCCVICNRMKLDYDKEEWINHMKLILNHLEANNG